MIVVFDASSFVSAVLKANSRPEQALLRAVGAPNQLLLSQAIEDEYRVVIFVRSLIASSACNCSPGVIAPRRTRASREFRRVEHHNLNLVKDVIVLQKQLAERRKRRGRQARSSDIP